MFALAEAGEATSPAMHKTLGMATSHGDHGGFVRLEKMRNPEKSHLKIGHFEIPEKSHLNFGEIGIPGKNSFENQGIVVPGKNSFGILIIRKFGKNSVHFSAI